MSASGPEGRYAFKVLCPDSLVAGLLGVSGKAKEAIEEETRTKLSVSVPNERFPGTPFRILAIYSSEPAGVLPVLMKILERSVQLGDKEKPARPWRTSGEPDYLGLKEGEYCLRFVIATKMSSSLIGPSGSHVQRIRQQSGAKILVDKTTVMAQQAVRVYGNQEALAGALPLINIHVQGEAGNDWYAGWATSSYVEGAELPSAAWYDRWTRVGTTAPGRESGTSRSNGHPPSNGLVIGGSSSSSSPAGAAAAASNGRAGLDRSRSPRGSRSATAAAAPVAGQGADPGLLQAIAATAKEHPLVSLVLIEDYAVSCDLPANRSEAMSGYSGEHLAEVEDLTGTRIRFEPVPDCDDLQSLVIEGPLLEVYRAHSLMMARYHQVAAADGDEPQSAEQPADQPVTAGAPSPQPAAAPQLAPQAPLQLPPPSMHPPPQPQPAFVPPKLPPPRPKAHALPDEAKAREVNALKQELQELQERLAKVTQNQSQQAAASAGGYGKGKTSMPRPTVPSLPAKGWPKGKGKGKG